MVAPTRVVVGAGAWGTTLATLLGAKGPVTLLARDEAQAAAIDSERENTRRLPGIALPETVTVSADPDVVAGASELVILAVPSRVMRGCARSIAGLVHGDAVVVSVAKGIEAVSLQRMTEVIVDEIPAAADRVAALSGPNLAPEIARGLPAGSVVGAADDAVAGRVITVLGSRMFRLYSNTDMVGVELAGALKNIIAIVAGAVDQLEAGDNGKAAITTRGLTEITRLGVAMGANPLTFAGLAGMGDILATCNSPLSRNHRLGMELASGRSWAEVEGSLPGVAEGAYTVKAAVALAGQHRVEMPIAREVDAVLYEGKSVAAALMDLLSRDSKDELTGLG